MSLVDYRSHNGLEAFLVLNRPVFKAGESARVNVLIRSLGYGGQAAISVVDSRGALVYKRNINVEAGQGDVIALEHGVPDKPGTYALKLSINDVVFDEVEYLVVDGIASRSVVALVWHNHQAPNYLPDGTVHGPWAYIYAYGKQLEPYGQSPYMHHVNMLEKHGDYRATFNLSPSLLYQWRQAITKGVMFQTGERIEPGDERAKLIEVVLDRYIEYAKKGQIDILTSIYAHTIGGFLIEYLDIYDIVNDEVRYGKEVSRSVLKGYEPLGAWTPEMAFSMKIVDIYYDNEIEYTILDDICHFEGSVGEKGSRYEPYIVLNKENGKHIFVVFRDHRLSDLLSFKNNFVSEPHALRNAYQLAYVISKRITESSPKLLTLALDGENWMAFSSNPPLTAYYYDKLLIYLESLSDIGFLELDHLRNVVHSMAARRILTHIPTNSWLCSFKKWRGERPEHEQYWTKANETYKMIRAYESLIGGRDSYSEKGRWALWHALDSDYWWSEFWLPKVIEVWLQEAMQALLPRFNSLKVKDIVVREPCIQGYGSEAKVVIENGLEKQIKAKVVLLISGCDEPLIREVSVQPRTTIEETINFVPCLSGEVPIAGLLLGDNYVVSSRVKWIKVFPQIRPPS